MRLVLVHGINNQGRSSQQIADEWLVALRGALPENEYAAIASAEVIAPYFGDVLAEAARAAVGAGPVALSADPTARAAGDEADFYQEALEDMAPAAGVKETDVRIAAGLGDAPVEQGLPHDRRLLALVRALEAVSPLHGALALRFLPQAFAYLHRANVTQAVDAIVAPALTQPAIVVGHSLGTIVAYKLLRDSGNVIAPFYLTLGSPLAIKAVQNGLGPPFERPVSITRWLNALDPNDGVTIGRILKETTFGPGIENLDDVDNGEDPHSAIGYLSDHRIASALARSLNGR